MFFNRYSRFLIFVFFFNDTATTEIYTLSLHDALPIFSVVMASLSPSMGETYTDLAEEAARARVFAGVAFPSDITAGLQLGRSEEHTSELQSHLNLVCRLLLEKKKHSSPTCS